MPQPDDHRSCCRCPAATWRARLLKATRRAHSSRATESLPAPTAGGRRWHGARTPSCAPCRQRTWRAFQRTLATQMQRRCASQVLVVAGGDCSASGIGAWLLPCPQPGSCGTRMGCACHSLQATALFYSNILPSALCSAHGLPSAQSSAPAAGAAGACTRGSGRRGQRCRANCKGAGPAGRLK